MEKYFNFNLKDALPNYVNKIIDCLEAAGYEAYAVGGCVRDMLLGLTPDDYDVTTAATPDEVKSALSDFVIHDTGLKHGTVTVVADDFPVEVTTFRIDGDYTDNRHPDNVTFTRSLKEDLSRRDFTINAMAYRRGSVIDYFGGQKDLSGKLIRAVGEPQKRFKEDGLRILRALRFAAVYGFAVESDTAKAVHELRGLINNIAGERVAQELNKLVTGSVSGVIADYTGVFAEFIPEIAACKNFNQHNRFHDRDVLTHTLNAVDNAPADKVVRLALLFHDMGKPITFKLVEDNWNPGCLRGSFKAHAAASTEIARKTMRSLKYDNDTFYKVCTLVKYHDIPIKTCEKAIKRLLNRFGEEMFFKLIDVHMADDSAKAKEMQERIPTFRKATEIARKIIADEECFSLKQLAVKGGDLVQMGYQGREVGEKLNFLLQSVISDRCANEKKVLTDYLKSRDKRKIK